MANIIQKNHYLNNSVASKAIRDADWSSTSLGALHKWPRSLHATLNIILNAPIPMFIVWGNESLFLCNDAYLSNLNIPGTDVDCIGKPAAEVLGSFWHDLERVISDINTYVKKSHNSFILPGIQEGASSTEMFEVICSALIDDELEIAGALATCYKTEVKINASQVREMGVALPSQEETQLRSLIKIAPVATALFKGPDFIIDIANEVMLNYWGKGDDIVGKPFRDLIPELERQDFIEKFRLVYSSGKEYKALGQKATYVQNGILVTKYFDYTLSPVFNALGNVISILNMANDVSAQVQSVQAQIESEAHLQLLRDTVPAMIFYLDKDQRYLSVNKIFLEWFNSTGAEAIGKTVREFLGEVTYEKTKPHLDVAYSGEQEKYELYAPTRMGIPRWLSIVYTPHVDEQGEVTGVIVHATDITQHKQTEIALRKSEARLLSVFDAAPVGICLFTGPDFIIETPNQPFILLAGKGNDIAGKSLLEVLPELRQQRFDEMLNKVYTTGQSFMASGQPGIVMRSNMLKQGYYNISLTPLFDNDNKIYAILSVIADVTEEMLSRNKIEEAEKALRSVIDLAQLGTWTMDINTGTVTLSQRNAEMFGLSNTTHSIESAALVIVDEDAQYVKNAFAEAMQKGSDGKYEAEYRIINAANGKQQIIHAQGQTRFDDAGNPVSITGTTRDVTIQKELQTALETEVQLRTTELAGVLDELKKSNGTLEATNGELKRSNEELSQYAYVASHDLQEPLRKIRFFTGLLAEGSGRLSREELIAKINRSAGRMSSLITDLLSFSRLLETTALFHPVDLNAVITAVWDDFELVAEEKGATLVADGLPTIKVLGIQMNQLFYNLFSNALKFTDPHIRPAISLKYALIAPDALSEIFSITIPLQYYHHIRFIDNGIGFETHHADQIFEIFKRLHSTNDYPGSGIGLALCRRIVINHHGYLYAESEPGEGSIFHILLPAET